MKFPIDDIKEEIIESLKHHDFIIIKSTPGSGKTTRIPLFLKEVYRKKIYILEPRRLAAKLASQFVALSLGELPGVSVGHIFKYENNTTPNTQIIYLTEGTFLRILKESNNLKDTDIVILDEFHERHIHTDIALSYLLKMKESNPNLKFIIMSATIETTKLENLLKNSKTIELEQLRHPIHISHLENNTLVLQNSLERKVLNAVSENYHVHGHILIFLPGMFEIKKCQEILENKFVAEIIILHGDLNSLNISEDFQNLNHKKIILSTNIAESSVTIPGVRVVIDSGLHRTSAINPITRLPIIELKKTSQSSAIQRAHRSNREEAGLVLRLYSQLDFLSRPKFDQPEILRSDLCDFILKTYDLFSININELNFLDKPLAQEIQNSEQFLTQIGFINPLGISKIAKDLAAIPMHPRILKILAVATKYNKSTLKQVIEFLALLVEPKNTMRFSNLCHQYFKSTNNELTCDIDQIILEGFVDQLAKIKNEKSFELIHKNGEIYKINPELHKSVDFKHPYWIILSLDNKNQVTNMLPIEEEWLYDLENFPIEEKREFSFNKSNNSFSTEQISHIGAIVLDRQKINHQDQTTLSSDAKIFLAKEILNQLKVHLEKSQFQRLFLLEKKSLRKIADFNLDEWILLKLDFFENGNLNWVETIFNDLVIEIFDFLNNDKIYSLENDLPLELKLTDKRKVSINYHATNGASAEGFIQDFYGLESVPTILKGHEKLSLHLLGPHKRALQVTQDLKSFWNKTYKEMHSQLKRDYPRHYWPEDPMTAKPFLLLRHQLN